MVRRFGFGYHRRMSTDLVCVATFNDLTEAHLARGVLEAAGIDAELRHGDLSGHEGHLGAAPMVELWCARDDVRRAKAELARGEQAAPPRVRASWNVVVILALIVTSVLGWVRVWSLERPPGFHGSWNLSGTMYVDKQGSATRESLDADRNGISERIVIRSSRGRVSTYIDEDQDGVFEALHHVEDSGVTSFVSDTDGNGEYDREVTAVPGRGSVVTTWAPSSLMAHHVRTFGADGGVHGDLTDDDHDGRFEHGVFHVGDGLVITSEDRDGDGFFERREVMRDGGLLFWDRLRADGVVERGP